MSYYETGSAPDVNNMLGKLRTALVGNGWTLNYNDFEGASGGTRCHLSKGGMTVNLRSGFNNEVPVANSAERSSRQGNWRWNYTYSSPSQAWRPDWIAVNVGTGVNLSRSWHNQPGAPGSGELRGLASMITAQGSISRYWLFIHEDPDFVLLVCETRANKFEHIAFGRLVLTQEIQAGGEWFSASRRFNDHYTPPQEVCAGILDPSYSTLSEATAFFRVEDTRWEATDKVDGWGRGLMTPGVPNSYGGSNYWASLGVPLPDSTVQYPSTQGFNNLINSSYLDAEGRSILHPISCWKFSDPSGLHPIGYIPHMARTSLKAYVAGDEIAGVGEAYMAFPNHMRISPWSITQLGSSPSNPADEIWNYYGTGIAVKVP